MSFWESIFADSHFAGASWSLPIGDIIPQSGQNGENGQNGQNNNEITLSPLHFVTDVEPVGHTYHKLVFPDIHTYIVPVLQEDEIDVEELLDSVREADLEDYYSLLFVKEKGLAVAPDDVKKTWKLINLYLHPDKADPSRKAEAEVRFKACMKAYETFLDPQLKIDYDSSIAFDDSTPSSTAGTKSLGDFIKVYGPVFERNGRWSKKQPVPSLGDENTSEADLTKFYNFWISFSSWRTFPSADTEKVGDSAGRDERRRAAQKNEKARAIAKAKDDARIRALVTQAQTIDPRMKAFKQQRLEREKAAKQAAYDAKQNKAAGAVGQKSGNVSSSNNNNNSTNNVANNNTSINKTDTHITTPQPPQQPQLALAPNAKRPAETVEEKQAEFIEMVRGKLHGALMNDKHFIINLEKRDQIPIIVEKVIGDYPSCKRLDELLLINGYVDLKGINGRRILEIEPVMKVWDALEGREPVPEKLEKGVWSTLEEKALNESLIKIPVGTKDRYAKITIQVNLVNGKSKRVEKEIIRKVKELELIQQVGMEQYKILKAQAQGQVIAQNAPVVSEVQKKTEKKVEKKSDDKKDDKKSDKKDDSSKKSDKKDKKSSENTPQPVVWSAEEQKLLEKGLQTIPKDVADRWEQIGAVVSTKTGPQCEARFNWLREQIAAKKAAAAAAAK